MKHPAARLWLALLGTLALSACQDKPAPQQDIRPVRYVIAGGSAAPSGDSYAGEIRPRHETQLAFRVAGKVVAKLVNSGEHVKKGQPLARLDPGDYQLDLAAKQAQLAAAESDLAQQQLNLKRYRELLAKAFISQAQVDAQQNGVAAARAKVDQARAGLASSRNQTDYTTLAADADGVVSQMQAEPGMVVAAGQPVAKLSQDGAREVAIQVPENALEQVRRAGGFQISLWKGGAPLPGALRELAADADPATRTYPARIALSGDSHALQLGMTANVRIPGHAVGQALSLPLTAVLDLQGKHYVWLIDPRSLRVSRKPVSVGTVDNDSIAIADGVRPGDKVVTAGVHLLREQQRVKLLAQ
ncbi:efflux RND transporter periplasmic adaptor subunit [Chromobacterium sphagni]|uniref:Efflux transporter periplasmic adaptor subunit n=1 Tax=Chromobacterium sphagni TaxID=1903179 RepID=A0A1S1WZT0_9NEIS|nr:efflux RND transporter periplasmic adaptor subunit [Chromobacterium sphagni]OHX12774.1 efflux transporter periplasmic adaptor subunit [Chromobacterium sphagni]OHX20849.1 efflux transporter periplasmic adaptor subunit [Chromobacterium sphagni]